VKKSLILGAAAAALFASPAMAQESDVGGFRIGVLVGLDSVSLDDGSGSSSESDIMYGVTAGYDADVGGAVVGVEVEYSDSSVGISETNVLVAGDEVSLSAGGDFYAGVRVGAQVGEDALIYVKGGYTTGRAVLAYDDNVSFSFSEGEDLGGYRLGVGGEFGLSPNVAVRVEYRYSDYGEYSYMGTPSGLSANRHQGVVAVVARI
jgi:outer membrane immunogenic protein